ncbi:diadenylate cyclase CdaA [Salinibacter ruber]|uniref:Diadenylate cyclase n=1 Tax=Salinibacter ruber TaxID=146919 RepID=A0A9X2ZZ10_9BACT|nr:diadenylate cyclase CdaA [Salinibacter ruber]MCS3611923.1 diadenylate cyclase [Salinibacter ruber]MCS3615386.1 diadenylate cyclase [Salinibacter ruber]MCS3646468.1 diadenylate cyclase [Salinibacter ruber]MCS3675001.1 diadenylate cyclase [Salinibacter ruber]MCS3784206.1 diadenylate cyclase [Salinibacter ruber]
MKFFEIIGFGIGDAIEIVVVAYILYQLYRLMRGTIAVQIALGLGALFLIQFVVELADMTVLTTVFSYFNQVFVLAVIIIFQPEIRRLLLLLGKNPIVRRFVSTTDQRQVIDETVGAVEEMSQQQIGALMAFQRSTGLRSYVETGELLEAEVSRDLLLTIFYGQNPLHDGAVIINNRRVEAARCILPVSTSMKLSPQLGLRHRAAVGLTEQTDAFVVVVSEETGDISVSRDGALISNITPEELRTYLTSALTGQSTSQASATVPASA